MMNFQRVVFEEYTMQTPGFRHLNDPFQATLF